MIVELEVKEGVELHGVGRKVELVLEEKTESRASAVFSHIFGNSVKTTLSGFYTSDRVIYDHHGVHGKDASMTIVKRT